MSCSCVAVYLGVVRGRKGCLSLHETTCPYCSEGCRMDLALVPAAAAAWVAHSVVVVVAAAAAAVLL